MAPVEPAILILERHATVKVELIVVNLTTHSVRLDIKERANIHTHENFVALLNIHSYSTTSKLYP
jgi:hypothetical protein